MRSVNLYYSGCEENYQPHFLDACFLCQRPLTNNGDIFMYRGNTPFCSQECRQEQIEIDECEEKRWKKLSSSSSKRSSNHIKSKESTKESNTNQSVRTGTVAVS